MTYTARQILRENISRYDHDEPPVPELPGDPLDLDDQIEQAINERHERERLQSIRTITQPPGD